MMRSKKLTKKHFIILTYVILLVTLVIISFTIYYVHQRDTFDLDPFNIIHFDNFDNQPKCHFSKEGDELPSANDVGFSPRSNSIFFHETSCRGGLNTRQACSIEAAARAHPEKEIYVLFSAPVGKLAIRKSCITKLLLIPNIKIARVHITEYAKNTPLEEIISNKIPYKSAWWVEHTSDLLRYLTLYKWGGVYLDTDILTIKSLLPLGHNWIGKEDNKLVNGAAISISMDQLGRKFITAIMNEVKNTYRTDIWEHNGPGALTRVLTKMCKTDNVPAWSSEICDGFNVYDTKLFYPVGTTRSFEYFDQRYLGPKIQKNAYGYHLWNKLTRKKKIDSNSPYARMAFKLCPTIFDIFDISRTATIEKPHINPHRFPKTRRRKSINLGD